MPTQTFLKLSKERQERIMQSARNEFSKHLYEEASINRIIKDINMCRGTFYLYFENKEDLYFYMLETLHDKANELVLDISNKEKGNIRRVFLSLYDYLTRIDDIRPLINNIFINFNTKHVEKVMSPKCDKHFFNLFDFKEYNINDEEKFIVLHVLETMLVQSIGIALRNKKDINKIRSIYVKEVDIILRGIERRNIC